MRVRVNGLSGRGRGGLTPSQEFPPGLGLGARPRRREPGPGRAARAGPGGAERGAAGRGAARRASPSPARGLLRGTGAIHPP